MRKCNNNILNLGSISEQAHRIKQLENAVSTYINPDENDATYNSSALRMK